MSKYFTILLSFMFLIGITNNCTTERVEDSPENVPPVETSELLYHYQSAKISFQDKNLEDMEYNGTLGGKTITLIRADEKTLVFEVPADIAPGISKLDIPKLNYTSNYKIDKPQLKESADAAVAPFFNNVQSYFANIANPTASEIDAKNSFDQLQRFYDTKATPAEKEKIALYYQINKQSFNEMLNQTTSLPTGKLTPGDIALVWKFSEAVVFMCGGGIAVWGGDPIIKIIGAVLVKIAKSKAERFHDALRARNMLTVSCTVDDIFGTEDKFVNNQSNVIKLVDNKNAELTFKFVNRPLIQKDNELDSEIISAFFTGQDSYNFVANKLNAAIIFVNDYNPFFTLKQVNLASLQTDPAKKTIDPTQELIERLKFNISHPNLQLVDAVITPGGNLKVKVKIVGDSFSLPILSKLNYSYSDDVTNFKGHFDIRVDASIVGTWVCESFENGLPLGAYYDLRTDPRCPNVVTQAYTLLSEKFIIGESSFSFSEMERYINYNKIYNEYCGLTGDKPDTTTDYPLDGSGSYVYDSGTITAMFGGNKQVFSVEFININKVKINDRIYKRQ